MSDTYGHCDWDRDYATPDEEETEPMDSDEALEEYINRRRMEFYSEWFQYIKDSE